MSPLRILILSHHFPPEVSAGASRFYELARDWAVAGHRVTVVTCAPNHPTGVLYPGYRNRLWQRETIAGIEVIRLWTFVAPNKGFFRRTLSHASYLVSTTLATPFLPQADVLISTTPHFFCGISGYPVSRLRRMPWVLDIRDLWPESIVAVGAMKPGPALRVLKAIERFGYSHAAHIVSASEGFLPYFEKCGVRHAKVSVVTNGVDRSLFAGLGDPAAFREQHSLEGKFLAVYVGTHGMAHQLDIILQAADRLRARTDITFVLVGDGAERQRLVEQSRAMALPNLLMLPQMPREQIPDVWAASDAAIVTLRATPLFELVIPSKMFEAMAMRRPIILGVRGQAHQIVEGGHCGLTFPPGDAAGLADRVVLLAGDADLCRRLGENGFRLVASTYDRARLARKYLEVLERTVGEADDAERAAGRKDSELSQK